MGKNKGKKGRGSSGPQDGGGDQPGPSEEKGKKTQQGQQGGEGDQPGPSGRRDDQPAGRGGGRGGGRGAGRGAGRGRSPPQPGGPPGQPGQGGPREGQQQRQGGPPMQQGQPPHGGQQQRQGGPPMQQGPWGQSHGGQQQRRGGPPMQQGQPPHGGQQQRQGGPPMQQGQPPHGWQQQRQGGPPMQQGQPPQGWQQQRQGGPPMQQGQPPHGGQQQRQGGPPMQQGQPPHGGQQQRQGGPPMQQGQPPQGQPGGGQQQRPGGPPVQQAGPSQEATKQIRGDPKGQAQRGQQQPQRGQQQAALDQAVQSIARIDLGDATFVSKDRRNPGRMGRVIKVESNHLQLNLGKIQTAYHYDVAINPDTPKKFMRPVMESFRLQLFPTRYPAFDGKKNLYTSSPLTNNLNDLFEQEITIIEEDGRSKQFNVQVKFANKVDMTGLSNFLNEPITPQEAIQVVDIVLRMAPVQTCIPVGRSFFVKPSNGIIDLGEGMEMYHGFYQSAIRGWKPLLNVDVAHKAFPRNLNVVDAFIDVLSSFRFTCTVDNLKRLDDRQLETLTKFIRGLKVIYAIPNQPGSRKNYRVNGLGPSSLKSTFTHNNTTMNIVEYFARTKNYRLKYPELPTLWVGSIQRADKILLPIEFCVIAEGQAVQRKMTEEQTRRMIKESATNTAVRKNKIMEGLKRANYNASPFVKEFGFSVGDQFQHLDARVLDPPELQYKSRVARVNKGVWRSESFLTPVTINQWTIINANRFAPKPDDYNRMVSTFEQSARQVGMVFASRPTQPYLNLGGRQTYTDALQMFKSLKDKYDVIFVIVPNNGQQYSYVKKAAEIAVGCLTQCIKFDTVTRKMNAQTATNILLKVNSKLNGINHTFAARPDILKRPIMIMGADVTHPGPDSKNIPSVAAVTASHDPKAFQYNICWRLQDPKVEIISDMESITEEHLKFFHEKTHCKPEAIIVFRDGVSEGQFEQVRNAEIRAIRAACKKVQAADYEPKITFLVVQKRHHTRLFPLNPRDSEDRNMNVPAGTCVDTVITHPYMQDFYLVSHASIQGVAKPTKYCTLWDDNNLNNDQIEQLTYYLCHMFSRCTRSVSYPAPTYYAHLAAARGKVYIENDNLDMTRLRDEFMKFQIRDQIRKGLPMFFV